MVIASQGLDLGLSIWMVRFLVLQLLFALIQVYFSIAILESDHNSPPPPGQPSHLLNANCFGFRILNRISLITNSPSHCRKVIDDLMVQPKSFLTRSRTSTIYENFSLPPGGKYSPVSTRTTNGKYIYIHYIHPELCFVHYHFRSGKGARPL